MDFGFMFYTWF